MTSLYLSVEVIDAVKWAWVLCGCCIQNDWVLKWICIKFCVQLEHSFVETILMNQKAETVGRRWLAASSWQHAHFSILPRAECFGETSNHPGDSASLQSRFGTLWLMVFPRTKIIFEEEEILDCQWDSGYYYRAADGEWENGVRSQGAYFEGDWGIIVLCTPQCFLYPVFSSINVSIFHIMWLDTFWTDLVYKTFIKSGVDNERSLYYFKIKPSKASSLD